MEVVVDTAVDYDHIRRGVHIVDPAAEAQIVAGLTAGAYLVGKTGAADAVVVNSGQVAHFL